MGFWATTFSYVRKPFDIVYGAAERVLLGNDDHHKLVRKEDTEKFNAEIARYAQNNKETREILEKQLDRMDGFYREVVEKITVDSKENWQRLKTEIDKREENWEKINQEKNVFLTITIVALIVMMTSAIYQYISKGFCEHDKNSLISKNYECQNMIEFAYSELHNEGKIMKNSHTYLTTQNVVYSFMIFSVFLEAAEKKLQRNFDDTINGQFSQMIQQLQKLKDSKSSGDSQKQELAELIFAIRDDLNPSKYRKSVSMSKVL